MFPSTCARVFLASCALVIWETSAEVTEAIAREASADVAGVACRALQDGLVEASHSARQVLVYRCRAYDTCGGWGDRVAGLVGAAFLAVTTGRAFKVDAPGLEAAFRERLVPWAYDAAALQLSEGDDDILKRPAYNQKRFVPFPDPTFAGLSGDVAVLNSLNDVRFRQPMLQARLARYRVLYVVVNRGLSAEWYNWWAAGHGNRSIMMGSRGWVDAYKCIWDSLFAPTEHMLGQQVPMLNGSSPNLATLLGSLTSGDTFSLAVQVRIKVDSSSSRCIDARSEAWKRCLMNVTSAHAQGRRTIVVVVSNSRVAGDQAQHYFSKRPSFHEVWTHRLSGDIHTDRTYARDPDDSSQAELAFKHAMIDWFLMVHADALVLDSTSGFPVSASFMASSRQVLYGILSCARIHHAAVSRHESVCASRFC